jgi:anti-sigma regulatory factor (Ser/Thr protein kinase)
MARVRQISVIVEERSQVAEVRRETAALGAALGFDQQTLGRLAIAVTETATNIVKHAGRGRIFARALDAKPHDGLEIVAIDLRPRHAQHRSGHGRRLLDVGHARQRPGFHIAHDCGLRNLFAAGQGNVPAI